MPLAAPPTDSDDLVQPFQIDRSRCAAGSCGSGPAIDRILSQHDYPEPVAAMLGEAITLAVVLAGALKYDGIFTLQTKGDGPVRLMVADVSTAGAVRGYAQYDAARLGEIGDARPGMAPPLGAAICSAPAISPSPSTRARTPSATRASSSWPARPSPNAPSIISASRSRSRPGIKLAVGARRARAAPGAPAG